MGELCPDGGARIQIGAASLASRRVNRASHDVARLQIGVVRLTQQETSLAVDQPRAFAAQGLGRQRRRVQTHVDGGGMKLHELGIENLSPRQGGQGHPFALEGRRGRGGGEQAARPAGGQNHRRRRDLDQTTVRPARDHRADDPPVGVLRQGLQPTVVPDLDPLFGADRRDHGRQDGAARAVAADPRHARGGMGGFQTNDETAVRIAVERRAQGG